LNTVRSSPLIRHAFLLDGVLDAQTIEEIHAHGAPRSLAGHRRRCSDAAVDIRNLTGKSVVVTGAGSGIGRATALAVASRGARVFTCDMNAAGMDETESMVKGGGSIALKAVVDVSKAGEMQAFADAVHRETEAVDLLVNNAGVALGARFQDTSLDDWRWIVDINLMGVVHGCHVFVPRMVSRGRGGHVVNIASMAGYVPAVATTAYCVTKAGVVSLSECLRIELAESGIGVTAICPGVIDTPIVRAGRRRGLVATEAAMEEMVRLFKWRGYLPERVAENILRAVQSDRAVAPVTPEAWALYFMKRTAPGLLLGLSGWLGRRMEASARKAVETPAKQEI
jgi:NAD(P)-dependent dehydrogenase (short-subunit alcohol dehydrogenase family)